MELTKFLSNLPKIIKEVANLGNYNDRGKRNIFKGRKNFKG